MENSGNFQWWNPSGAALRSAPCRLCRLCRACSAPSTALSGTCTSSPSTRCQVTSCNVITRFTRCWLFELVICHFELISCVLNKYYTIRIIYTPIRYESKKKSKQFLSMILWKFVVWMVGSFRGVLRILCLVFLLVLDNLPPYSLLPSKSFEELPFRTWSFSQCGATAYE